MTWQNAMSLLLTLLIAGGCATTVSDPWTDIDTESPAATRPLDCGHFPIPDVIADRSITYKAAGVTRLDLYRECAEGNQDIANAHADQVDALNESNAALVDAGKHQYAISEMRREILEEERQHMMWERVQYWVVIIGLALAL